MLKTWLNIKSLLMSVVSNFQAHFMKQFHKHLLNYYEYITSALFWSVTLCNLVDCFGRTCCPHFRLEEFISCKPAILMRNSDPIYAYNLSFTYGSEPFLRICQLCSYSITSQYFMEPKNSLPFSRKPFTNLYLKPDRSSPYHSILSL
jgi:hypothetical protein